MSLFTNQYAGVGVSKQSIVNGFKDLSGVSMRSNALNQAAILTQLSSTLEADATASNSSKSHITFKG